MHEQLIEANPDPGCLIVRGGRVVGSRAVVGRVVGRAVGSRAAGGRAAGGRVSRRVSRGWEAAAFRAESSRVQAPWPAAFGRRPRSDAANRAGVLIRGHV